MAEAAFSTKIRSITFKNVSPIDKNKHRQEMDPHFIRMLRSIGHVEKTLTSAAKP